MKAIYVNQELDLEVLYYDHQIIFIKGDLVHYFDAHTLLDTIVFVKLLAKAGITELQRAQIMVKVMNCVDEEIEKDKIDKTHGR